MNDIFMESILFDISIDKCNFMLESSYVMNKNKLREDILLVYENIYDVDELSEVMQESMSDFTQKVRAILTKIKDAILKFLRMCGEKILEVVTVLRNSVFINKIESLCKKDPSFANKKVQINTYEKELKMLDNDHMTLKQKLAKAKQCKLTDRDIDEVEKREMSTQKKLAIATGITAGTTITIAGLIILFKKLTQKTKVDIDQSSEEVNDVHKLLNKLLDDGNRTLAPVDVDGLSSRFDNALHKKHVTVDKELFNADEQYRYTQLYQKYCNSIHNKIRVLMGLENDIQTKLKEEFSAVRNRFTKEIDRAEQIERRVRDYDYNHYNYNDPTDVPLDLPLMDTLKLQNSINGEMFNRAYNHKSIKDEEDAIRDLYSDLKQLYNDNEYNASFL